LTLGLAINGGAVLRPGVPVFANGIGEILPRNGIDETPKATSHGFATVPAGVPRQRRHS
jgi:hypothetical protein